ALAIEYFVQVLTQSDFEAEDVIRIIIGNRPGPQERHHGRGQTYDAEANCGHPRILCANGHAHHDGKNHVGGVLSLAHHGSTPHRQMPTPAPNARARPPAKYSARLRMAI